MREIESVRRYSTRDAQHSLHGIQIEIKKESNSSYDRDSNSEPGNRNRTYYVD
jgi:hypothetical protein